MFLNQSNNHIIQYKSYHYNGQLEIHCYLNNGNLEGEYKSYHDNGQLWSHRYYKNGKLEGEYKDYYSNAQLYKQFYYKDGIDITDKVMKLKEILE
jgi:antitoxin component YwqK of YwqJK toxin-antitoxin module